MRTMSVTIKIPDIGDYVRTPQGVGVIKSFTLDDDYTVSVEVQHKFGTGENPSNKLREVEYRYTFSITKEEYDQEKHW